jgi:hypothetical protein
MVSSMSTQEYIERPYPERNRHLVARQRVVERGDDPVVILAAYEHLFVHDAEISDVRRDDGAQLFGHVSDQLTVEALLEVRAVALDRNDVVPEIA